MDQNDWNSNKLFSTALVLSVAVHAIAIGIGSLKAENPDFSVINAPNSIEIVVLESLPISRLEILSDASMADEQLDSKFYKENDFPQREDLLITGKPKKLEVSVNEKLTIKPSQHSLGATREAQSFDIVNPAPEYPIIARKKGWEGTVILDVNVDKQGEVLSVGVKESWVTRPWIRKLLKQLKHGNSHRHSAPVLNFQA